MKTSVEVLGSWRQKMTKRHRKCRYNRAGQKMSLLRVSTSTKNNHIRLCSENQRYGAGHIEVLVRLWQKMTKHHRKCRYNRIGQKTSLLRISTSTKNSKQMEYAISRVYRTVFIRRSFLLWTDNELRVETRQYFQQPFRFSLYYRKEWL